MISALTNIIECLMSYVDAILDFIVNNKQKNYNKQAIVFFDFNYYLIIDRKTRFYNQLKEEGMSMYQCM